MENEIIKLIQDLEECIKADACFDRNNNQLHSISLQYCRDRLLEISTKKIGLQPKPETVRYFVDVLYSPEKWGNLEVVLDEQEAKAEANKWVDWLTANKHVWFEIKIVKEIVTQEAIETYHPLITRFRT